jgi:hypothetical protein
MAAFLPEFSGEKMVTARVTTESNWEVLSISIRPVTNSLIRHPNHGSHGEPLRTQERSWADRPEGWGQISRHKVTCDMLGWDRQP